MNLKISSNLHLPTDAITQTFGILAMRGSGKTNTAVVLAEEMYRCRLPFVVVDPVGVWYGLRSSGDGKSAGLLVPIFGGKHGDVPLERGGGELIADIVVDERLCCVLDLSEFESEAAKKEFLLAFARRLYRRNTEPLHLFLEEADDYCPQRPMRDEAYLLRAFENIVRRGRSRGLGITMITQRSASLNKNVLTQIETLIVMRTTSPQDRKAIQAWVEYHAQSKALIESLPGLKTGQAWVWSPQWLGGLKQIKVRFRQTFDSAATPKQQKTRPAATLAAVDLSVLKKRMAATIERAKVEDPKQLCQRIRELERELKQKPPVETNRIEVKIPVVSQKQLAALRECAHKMEKAAEKLAPIQVSIDALRSETDITVNDLREVIDRAFTKQVRTIQGQGPTKSIKTRPGGANLAKGQRRTLTAIAQHREVTREQLAVLTGYKTSSRNTYIQRLRENGYIEKDGNALRATNEGVIALGSGFETLPTGNALRDYWLTVLPKGEREILSILCAHYPRHVSRQHISDETGYALSSRNTYLQRLHSRKLVKSDGAGVRAADTLFG